MAPYFSSSPISIGSTAVSDIEWLVGLPTVSWTLRSLAILMLGSKSWSRRKRGQSSLPNARRAVESMARRVRRANELEQPLVLDRPIRQWFVQSRSLARKRH